MSVQELKNQLHKAIDETEDEALLQHVYSVLKGMDEAEWNKLPDSVKESIELSLQKVEAGKVLSHEEAQKRIGQVKNLLENHNDWPDDFLPTSLLSPDDEKNIRRIWKSPGGC